EIRDVDAAETALQALATREDGPFVVKLPREPGRREARYAHLFGGPIEIHAAPESPEERPPSEARGPSLADRVARLEEVVSQLQRELQRVKEKEGDSG